MELKAETEGHSQNKLIAQSEGSVFRQDQHLWLPVEKLCVLTAAFGLVLLPPDLKHSTGETPVFLRSGKPPTQRQT